MSLNLAIDAIQHERDFKVLCDGLLRFELGSLVQTYGSAGSDEGVDAEFKGKLDGVKGRWVFQYKFTSPTHALSRRRSWLSQRYVGSTKRQSEFDKPGVKGADGYILLTNTPVTVQLVRNLTSEWRKRRYRGPFCVWDPSRLNAMMKGHEHLARSWTGAREARCHQAIVFPLWQWLDEAVRISVNWANDPLWPLEIRSSYEVSPRASFSQSLSAKNGLILVPRTSALREASLDPQFEYASLIAYPRAMQRFKPVKGAVDVLAKTVLGHVDELSGTLLKRLPPLERLPADSRSAAQRVLAYCILENRWGFPMRGFHSIRDGRLVAQARYYAWMEPAMPEVEPLLDDLVREVPHGTVGRGVRSARTKVEALLREWWERMWHVVSFGIDAEQIE
jgi:hypothetical protein